MRKMILLVLTLIALLPRLARASPLGPPPIALVLADLDGGTITVAPVAVDVAGKVVTVAPAPAPDVTNLGADAQLVAAIASAAKAKNYLLLASLLILALAGLAETFLGRVWPAAKSALGTLALHFLVAFGMAAVAVASVPGVKLSLSLALVVAGAALASVGGWAGVVKPVLAWWKAMNPTQAPTAAGGAK